MIVDRDTSRASTTSMSKKVLSISNKSTILLIQTLLHIVDQRKTLKQPNYEGMRCVFTVHS